MADELYGRSAPVLVGLHVGLGSEIPRGASPSNLGNYRHAVTASCAFEEDVDRALDAADCAGQRHSQDPGHGLDCRWIAEQRRQPRSDITDAHSIVAHYVVQMASLFSPRRRKARDLSTTYAPGPQTEIVRVACSPKIVSPAISTRSRS